MKMYLFHKKSLFHLNRPVSYTHLDVYKRQAPCSCSKQCKLVLAFFIKHKIERNDKKHNHCLLYTSHPSPAILTTVLSGLAVWAPIAAPRPYPMVPRPVSYTHLDVYKRQLLYI